jgi:hypothetical protein
VILRRRKPWIAIEAKLTEQPLDNGLRYLLERVPVPHAFQAYLARLRTSAPYVPARLRTSAPYVPRRA